MAVFEERQPEPPVGMPAPALRERADSAGNSGERMARSAPQAPMEEKKLGTGHGEREHSAVSYTDFRRASNRPVEIVTLRYDSRANLVAMGVLPRPSQHRPHRPDPFPESRGFVPDPPPQW